MEGGLYNEIDLKFDLINFIRVQPQSDGIIWDTKFSWFMNLPAVEIYKILWNPIYLWQHP